MKLFKNFLILGLSVLTIVACNDDEDEEVTPTTNNQTTNASQTYDLASLAGSGVSGNAVITDNDDGTITLDLNVSGTSAGNSHPAHIHYNTAAEGGGIAVSLNPVDGGTGSSSTTFSTLSDNTPISYSELLNFDGYINIHLSSTNLGTVVAQGDIGQNDLTGTTKTYTLGSKAVAGIQGDIEFAERVNGEALAVISLQNTPAGGKHPAHIHMNSAIEGGGIALALDTVMGSTGMSVTNISMMNGQSFGYSELLNYDGYVNVHLSADSLNVIVAQGDIGSNELTGTSKSYTLAEVGTSGVSGNVLFSQRKSGETLAKISLNGTPANGSHPAHIHMNDITTTGGVVFGFPNVDGSTGESETNINALNDGTPFLYNDILSYNGYVNVHLSANNLSTIVAQGNIGSNE